MRDIKELLAKASPLPWKARWIEGVADLMGGEIEDANGEFVVGWLYSGLSGDPLPGPERDANLQLIVALANALEGEQ